MPGAFQNTLTRIIFSFRIAYQTEDQYQTIAENLQFDPNTLELTTLANGLPSYKTIHVPAFTEADAIRRADEYVNRTPYRLIEDNKTL